MEESKFDQGSSRIQEVRSVCSELNLDLGKLEDESLLASPIYRRLFNIVKNDMSRGDLSFRKNLIRELYFLLQVTPIIRSELKEKFLAEVEKMYNLNDHKKIDLASSKLNNLLSIVSHKKDSTAPGQERPKSGVTWNQDVIPFLRPYTATRQKQVKTTRPDSSKFNSQSTKVETIEETCIREFTTNIQEEFQISQDFIQKHRTNHPEYQPVYEQLAQILKKIDNNDIEDPIVVKPQPKASRYPRSALTRHKEESWLKPESNNRQSQQYIAEAPLQNAEEERRDDEEKDSANESSEQEEYMYVNQEKKPYKPYSKTIKIQQTVADAKPADKKLSKYTHLMNTKAVQALREDQELAKKYVDYARVKTVLKKEQNRRNESRRLMSAKPTTKSAIKFTRIGEPNKENLEDVKGLVVDLRKDPKVIASDPLNAYPTYNRRNLLKQTYQRPVQKFIKRNNIGFVQPTEPKAESLKRPLTSYARFNTPVKFDPMSAQNVRKYNADVLDEIEKIKLKVGGRCSASTESLMRALAVVEPAHEDNPLKWEDKNPFYNMVSIGKQKKLKRKTRKNMKSKTKTPVRR